MMDDLGSCIRTLGRMFIVSMHIRRVTVIRIDSCHTHVLIEFTESGACVEIWLGRDAVLFTCGVLFLHPASFYGSLLQHDDKETCNRGSLVIYMALLSAWLTPQFLGMASFVGLSSCS